MSICCLCLFLVQHHPPDASLFATAANGNAISDPTPRKKRGLSWKKSDKRPKDALNVSQGRRERGREGESLLFSFRENSGEGERGVNKR